MLEEVERGLLAIGEGELDEPLGGVADRQIMARAEPEEGLAGGLAGRGLGRLDLRVVIVGARGLRFVRRDGEPGTRPEASERRPGGGRQPQPGAAIDRAPPCRRDRRPPCARDVLRRHQALFGVATRHLQSSPWSIRTGSPTLCSLWLSRSGEITGSPSRRDRAPPELCLETSDFRRPCPSTILLLNDQVPRASATLGTGRRPVVPLLMAIGFPAGVPGRARVDGVPRLDRRLPLRDWGREPGRLQ